jgi:hypothetical protein
LQTEETSKMSFKRGEPESVPSGWAGSGGLRIAFWLISLALALLGLLFVIAAGQGNTMVRLIIGLVCWLAAGSLIYLARLQPIQQTHIHKMELDLSGDVSLQGMECKQCGAALGSESILVEAGAVFVNCSYCGASYQTEEAPKW